MAKSRPTIMKRQRELARAEKRRDKAARRAVRTTSDMGDVPSDATDDYDPDIAHIVPGPQPIPWADEFDDEPEDDGKESEEDGDDGESQSKGDSES